MSDETRRRSERDEAADLLRAAAGRLRAASKELESAAKILSAVKDARVMTGKAKTLAGMKGASGKKTPPVPAATRRAIDREVKRLDELAKRVQAHPITELERAKATASKGKPAPKGDAR